jgi:hypothetical protein
VPVHQRVAQREVLCHPHHRVVDGTVPVRVIFPHGVPHHGRTLSVPLVGVQVEVVEHRVQDATLHRLQAVTNVGQGSTRNDGQRIVKVPLPRSLVKWDRFRNGHGRRSITDVMDAHIVYIHVLGDTTVLSHGSVSAATLRRRVTNNGAQRRKMLRFPEVKLLFYIEG